jgi:hypothetical protein
VVSNLYLLIINISSTNGSQQKGYRPEGPVGIRYKKQMLVTRDLTSATFDSHMLEAAFKKRHFRQMFNLGDDLGGPNIEEDFQLQ